ncbi:MAG: MerR family transcriptional regulator [Alphaproteobacteria bacterium]|nr:MerR family transcriptional regulator [Alphaproteobacteria bacterium]
MNLSPSEAAKHLGVSTKALRLYEQRGLIAPVRTEAGWRTYNPVDMERAADVVRLQALGLSLAQVAQVLGGKDVDLAPLLAMHQAKLEAQARKLGGAIEKVRALRAEQAAEKLQGPIGGYVAFELPWPWGGEAFVLHDLRPLNYITGPLGCGKTRLAIALAQTLPKATFLGLNRLAGVEAQARAQLDTDPALRARVDQAMETLVEAGATRSPALLVLLCAFEQRGSMVLVVDMVEQDLDQATQEAMMDHLRRQASTARPVFMTTRSNIVLNLDALGPEEAIIHCPANHSPPTLVAPYPGAPGFEAIANCLASPDVRARTAGVIAHRPDQMI